MSVRDMVLAALVLMGFALAISRRSLALGTLLCFMALAFLGIGFAEWLRR